MYAILYIKNEKNTQWSARCFFRSKKRFDFEPTLNISFLRCVTFGS